VLIFKKFSKELFWGIPLTSSLKNKDKKYYFAFSSPSYEKESVAVLSQIKLFDSKRLVYKIGYIEKDNFLELKNKLIHLIDE
jgi:mRNA interferase MazF